MHSGIWGAGFIVDAAIELNAVVLIYNRKGFSLDFARLPSQFVTITGQPPQRMHRLIANAQCI
jgi:hypothetical protein